MTNTTTMRLETKTRATADGNFGAVRVTDTDTLVERDGGLQVTTRVAGHVEGSYVDRTVTKFYPGVTMQKAVEYRTRIGYVIVAG